MFSVEILNPGQAILENSTYLSCDDSLVGMLLKKSEDYSFVTVEKEPKAFLLYRLSVMSHQRQKHFPVQVLNQFLKLLLDFPPPLPQWTRPSFWLCNCFYVIKAQFELSLVSVDGGFIKGHGGQKEMDVRLNYFVCLLSFVLSAGLKTTC